MSIAIIGIPDDHDKTTADKIVECFVCEEQVPEKNTSVETVYDNPHSDHGREIHLCDDTCHIEDDNSEFSYWYCEQCDRYICQRNPGNGYQSWFKRADNGDDLICCACYQNDHLARGQPVEDFRRDHAAGTYSMKGDFYDDSDLEQAGFSKVPEWTGAKIQGDKSAATYCQHAEDLCMNGAAVITQYRSLSIIGNEGFVTMWTRRARQDEQDQDDDDCCADSCEDFSIEDRVGNCISGVRHSDRCPKKQVQTRDHERDQENNDEDRPVKRAKSSDDEHDNNE